MCDDREAKQEEVANFLAKYDETTEDDRDETLYDLLVLPYPTERTQNN